MQPPSVAPAEPCLNKMTRKVDVRLPGKGNSNSHGAKPACLIITMIKWIRASKLSIKNSLSLNKMWLAIKHIPRRALRGGISKVNFHWVYQLLAINAHKMAPRTGKNGHGIPPLRAFCGRAETAQGYLADKQTSPPRTLH